LAIHAGSTISVVDSNLTDTIQSRLRKQMQAEALQPISNNVEDDAEPPSSVIPPVDQFSDEFLEEAVQFLRLQVRSLFFFCDKGVGVTLFRRRWFVFFLFRLGKRSASSRSFVSSG